MKVHFTESMMGLRIFSNGVEYLLTGHRYFDTVNFLYWYETTSEVWVLGDSMKSRGIQ